MNSIKRLIGRLFGKEDWDVGSAGYPRGQYKLLYVRGWESIPVVRDPTMLHVRSDELEEYVSLVVENRSPHIVERNCFGNPNIVALKWFYNPEDIPVKESLK